MISRARAALPSSGNYAGQERGAVYFLLVEIDTFEVLGMPLGSPDVVHERIEKVLTERGRMPPLASFARLMASMRAGLLAKRKWTYAEGKVLITVWHCG